MLIVCPNCATSYNVEPAGLRPNGRHVRCVRCREVWHAELSQAERLVAAANALGPARHAAAVAAQAIDGRPDSPPPERYPAAAAVEAEWSGHAAADDQAAPPPTHADAAQPAADAGADADIDLPVFVDAQAPPIAPVDLDERQPPTDIAVGHAAGEGIEPLQDIETIAARRVRRGSRRAQQGWPLSRLQTAILALVLVDAIIVGWRADFVRAMPQTASFFAAMGLSVNLRGLDFADIATATEQHDGVPILVVEGNIVNEARKIVDVPRLKFAVRNAAKQEIYSWTAVPARTMLPPGEAVSFRTRLASPPPDGHDVLVRFVTRRDIVAGDR